MPVEVKLFTSASSAGGEYVRVECPGGKGELDLGTAKYWEIDPRLRVLRVAELR